jgi:ribosomal protein L7/L12
VSFKPENKIKVIKEVRGATSLGLKEVRVCCRARSPASATTKPLIIRSAPTPPPLHPTAQAKDLVETVPCTLMAKVKREDAVKIADKLKAETGAVVELV